MRTFDTSRGRFVAGVLVLALLLCHGAFGSMHLSYDLLAAPSETTDAHAEYGEDAASHHGGMTPEYLAVFAAFFFGSVLLLLRSKMSVFARGASFRPKVLPRTALFHSPARGPTLSHLQVFRL